MAARRLPQSSCSRGASERSRLKVAEFVRIPCFADRLSEFSRIPLRVIVRTESQIRVLLWRKRADNPLSLLRRRGVDFANILKLRQDLLDHPMPFLDVSDFAAAEYDRDDHFVFVGQEAAGLVDLEIDVVLAGFWANAD